LMVIQAFSLLSWICLLPVFAHGTGGGSSIWAIALIAGAFHVLGLVCTYRAFEIGTLSFVSPIASSFAIVTALLFVVSGSAPAPLALAGTVLLVAGVAVVSRSTAHDGGVTLRGVPEAIFSAVAFGVMFWLIDSYVRGPLGDVVPLILLKVMATSYAGIYASRAKKEEASIALFSPKTLALGLVAALLDTAAWIAFLLGCKAENGAVVTAMASLFSAITVLLAWIFLRERLNRAQWVGVAVILFGVLIVSLPK
jgi:drug/metabolite transporter (DMT)-like permease